MEYQIGFVHSPNFLSSTARNYWLRNYWLTYLCHIGIPLGIFFLSLTAKEITSSRYGTFFLGFLIGITTIVVFQFLQQFFGFEKAILEATKKWTGVTVNYIFHENGVNFESALASGNHTWQMVDKLLRLQRAWILVISEQDYVAIPAELLNDELKQFIIQKVSEAGGKVMR